MTNKTGEQDPGMNFHLFSHLENLESILLNNFQTHLFPRGNKKKKARVIWKRKRIFQSKRRSEGEYAPSKIPQISSIIPCLRDLGKSNN